MSATGIDGREIRDAGVNDATEAPANGITARARWTAEQARQRAQALAAGASEATARAGQGAEETVRSAGRQLESAGGQLREQSSVAAAAADERFDRIGAPDAVRKPAQATVQAVAEAAEGLAGRMERGGAYLEEQGAAGLLDDLMGVARRHPGPILGVVLATVTLFGLLVLLGRRRSG
jgi:hypothetical protein